MFWSDKFWILWIVYVYVRVIGNLIFCNFGEDGLLGCILIFDSIGLIVIILFYCMDELLLVCIKVFFVFLLLNFM